MKQCRANSEGYSLVTATTNHPISLDQVISREDRLLCLDALHIRAPRKDSRHPRAYR